jgi:uncharacterized membrane-anchored protein
MPLRHALVAEWPSGLGKGLQSPVHGFDSRLRLHLRHRSAWVAIIGVVPRHRRGFFPEPVAAKVPEIIFLFWVIKILTTAGGEATSDYLAVSLGSRLEAGAIEAGLFLIALVWQFRTTRYTAAAYWAFAYSIAIFGTGVADAMHLFVGIPYSGTSAIWAIVLAVIFAAWYRSERTLSIHSIYTQRREVYYWAVVFATFALGTALGDYTATALGLGYLASGILFFFVILIPAAAWKWFRLNSVVAFWCAYVVTRPLGASFADYFSKPHYLSGANYGDGPVALITTIIVAALVGYLAVARPDIQPANDQQADRSAVVSDDVLGR